MDTILTPSFKLREPKPEGTCEFSDCQEPAVGQVGFFCIAIDACQKHGDEWSAYAAQVHREMVAGHDRQFIKLVNSYHDKGVACPPNSPHPAASS